MNRAVAIVLAVICLPLGFSADLGFAQVEEAPDEKQTRIDRFQDFRLIYEPGKEGAYTLRQGPETIYDRDFVTLMNDPSLTRYWLGERNRDYAFKIGGGVLGVTAGTALFWQTFRGTGLAEAWGQPVPAELPGNQAEVGRAAAANASDWRIFTLSVIGVGLAGYGLYNLNLWLQEELDWYHPNRLEEESILPRVEEWNEDLRTRLNLEPEDIPSPPTPRPSTTPTPSPLPSGFVPPSPPVGGPGALPMGGPPSPVPTPLPVIVPGELPSPLLPVEASPEPAPPTPAATAAP
ncbi:MAG: hypothetical protein ACLGIN_06450 [Candidatus Sericytochromatia bacterium]